jgi:hypothetical protein
VIKSWSFVRGLCVWRHGNSTSYCVLYKVNLCADGRVHRQNFGLQDHILDILAVLKNGIF